MKSENLPPVNTPPPEHPHSQSEPVRFLGHDAEGKPLYGTPPKQPAPATTADTTDADGPTKFVHFTRQITPEAPVISEEVLKRHKESVQRYPWLNLSDGEYVISFVQRHFIGLFIPIGTGVFIIALIISVLINYGSIMEQLGVYEPVNFGVVALIGICLSILIGIGVYVAVWVYMNNRFFLTNESVIQEIQVSLFSKREQTVSLNNIEDASYSQHGIMQTMFNYGSIRLSTEGDETTYRFHYVENPRHQIAVLNNAVEAFKNGRPID